MTNDDTIVLKAFTGKMTADITATNQAKTIRSRKFEFECKQEQTDDAPIVAAAVPAAADAPIVGRGCRSSHPRLCGRLGRWQIDD